MFKTFTATQSNCVGIIPLDDSRFSSCKSPIKFFDYALAGIPTICSAVPPYSDVIEDGVHGMLSANTTQAWIEHIQELVSDAQLRNSLSSNARQLVVADFNMDIAASRWDGVLKGLVPDVGAYRKSVQPIRSSQLTFLFGLPSFVMRLVRLLLRPRSYLKALHILRAEGLGSLWLKLVSMIKPS